VLFVTGSAAFLAGLAAPVGTVGTVALVLDGVLSTTMGAALWRSQQRVLRGAPRAYQTGRATHGTLVDRFIDRSIELADMDGRSPWVIRYQYTIRGRTYTGRVWSSRLPPQLRRPGADLVVLYLADDPAVGVPCWPSSTNHDEMGGDETDSDEMGGRGST